MSEFLEDRRKALEEQFFARYNRQLLEGLKQKKKREALQEVSGIKDQGILDRLLELGIDHETFMAVSLVPLVEVAWADGSVHPKEREAILKAAVERGIDTDSPVYGVIDSYLEERPTLGLIRVWKDYIQNLCETIDPGERQRLKERVLTRGREVAQAAGGFLGSSKISDAERSILAELEEAFE